MTRDEILNLKGLELRKAVAKVKGYGVLQYDHKETPSIKAFSRYLLMFEETPAHPGHWRETEDEAWSDAPAFESCIAAAWTLVEETHLVVAPDAARGYNAFIATCYGDYSPEECIEYTIYYLGTADPEEWMHGKTAPEAICRAYLLAKAVSE